MDDPTAALSASVQEKLHQLIDELLTVNRQFNLTAVRDPGEAWVKHIQDSLIALELGLFEGIKSVIDVGTGPGFPGLPLLIARPQLKLTLLESVRKKCNYLETVAAKLELPAKVLCERAETVGQNKVYRERYHIATARAVGSLSEVCELTLPLVKVGGHAVLWRGAQAEEELKAHQRGVAKLGGEFGRLLPYHLSGHEVTYHLVEVHKARRTPETYPRREGLPKHQPL